MNVTDLGDGRCEYISVFMINTKGNLENNSHKPNKLARYFVKGYIKKTMNVFKNKVQSIAMLRRDNQTPQFKHTSGLYDPQRKFNELYKTQHLANNDTSMQL